MSIVNVAAALSPLLQIVAVDRDLKNARAILLEHFKPPVVTVTQRAI